MDRLVFCPSVADLASSELDFSGKNFCKIPSLTDLICPCFKAWVVAYQKTMEVFTTISDPAK